MQTGPLGLVYGFADRAVMGFCCFDRCKGGFTMTTVDLRQMNDRIRELRQDIFSMSEQ